MNEKAWFHWNFQKWSEFEFANLIGSNHKKMNIVVERLKDVEFVAEQILSDKQAIIEFDKQRQKNREAFKWVIVNRTSLNGIDYCGL